MANGIMQRWKGKLKAAIATIDTLTSTTFTATGWVRNTNVMATCTAAGSTVADATQLTGQINLVTTNSATTKGVILPLAATVGVGGTVTVFNTTANAVHVYGAGSDTIDGAAAGTGVVLTNAKRSIYVVTAAATYISAQLGVVSA